MHSYEDTKTGAIICSASIASAAEAFSTTYVLDSLITCLAVTKHMTAARQNFNVRQDSVADTITLPAPKNLNHIFMHPLQLLMCSRAHVLEDGRHSTNYCQAGQKGHAGPCCRHDNPASAKVLESDLCAPSATASLAKPMS